MKPTFIPFIRRASVLAGAWLFGSGVLVSTINAAPADAFPNFDSYIKLSGQAAAISGDKAAFQSRTQQPNDGGAGIEDLHISKDLSKSTTAVIDGKAMVGSEDYLARVNITKNEVGSVDAGYKRFRTFYDGVGGFFPLNKQWMPLANEDLHIDRSKFWIEANLNLPNAPVLTVRYTNELRDGRKDSTIWGSSDLTGLPFNLAPNPINPARKFTPSYINIGERHELLEATAKHTVQKTTLQLTVFADRTNNSNTRYVTNYPGEVIPWSVVSLSTTVPTGQVASPQALAKAALPANNWNNQQIIAETDAMKTQTQGLNFSADTILTDKVTLRVGGSYELVHTEIGGGRPLTTTTATSTDVVQVITDNYANLAGGTRVKDYTGNVALDLQPMKTLFVKLALRAQDEFVRGSEGYNVIAASGTPATTLASTPRLGYAKIHQNVQTPVLELRYTGIKDLALYFNGSKRSLNGVEQNSSAYNPLTATIGTPAMNNVTEDHGNYTLGANWRQSAALTLRAEVFHKGHKDNTVGFGTLPAIVGDYYLLDSTYSGYKLTALAKPFAQLGFTTRFIEQRGKMKVTGFLPTYPAYDSLNAKNYILSETIDLTPNSQCYFQLNGTAVYNVISTIYPRAGLTPAAVNTAGLTTANAFDSNGVLQNSDNNYVTAGFLSGFVVDKDTDAQVQINYYHADNGNAAMAAMTQPYGVAVKETRVTVGLKHKFSNKWVADGKIGYFDSQNDTTGGNTNFHGPLAYVSIQHGF
jgi:hypothetical protein